MLQTRPADLICFSHLRWSFVFQRPNHLLTRAARERRVLFIEEPVFGSEVPYLDTVTVAPNITVLTPHLPVGADGDHGSIELLDAHLDTQVQQPIVWMYTPMMLSVLEGLHCIEPSLVIYDCMDELSAFRGAPPALVEREKALFAQADLVFTGGRSLYEAKREHHAAVHAFPSSVDADHFGTARWARGDEPGDQATIPGPRLGFFGVIDERMDLELIDRLARERPDHHIVMIGPVVKIDPATLPRRPNIHWLGQKTYAELPRYLAGWDVAIMPFALNESTRFISPTKTLEYLAAGKPVVSTAIRDVVSPYGDQDVVAIADAEGFAAAIDRALSPDPARQARGDAMVTATSWDATWRAMAYLIESELRPAPVELLAQEQERSASCSTI